MPNNLLAVYPKSPPAAERCRLKLLERFDGIQALPNGWLVGRRPSSTTKQEHSLDELFIWEGRHNFRGSGGITADLDETAGHLTNLQGDVGFAQLGPHGRFLAVRSCSGSVATYLCGDSDALWISTSFEDLVGCRLQEARGDAAVQALWAEGWAVFPEGRTFIEGISIIPRGHYSLGDPQRFSTRPYWDPRAEHLSPPTESLAREHVEELRNALSEAMEALDPVGLNLLTLSGGVDSSALAHLAHARGFPLATLTFVAPRASAGRATQLAYVDSLVRELEIKHSRRLDAEDEFLEALFQRPLPALYFCPHPALRMLPQLATELRPRVLFSGHFADEVCGHSQRLQDWIRHTSLVQLLNPGYPHPSPLRDLGRWLKRRALESAGRPVLPLPTHVGALFSSSVQQEVREWCSRERQQLLSDPRPLRQLAAWCRLDGWVAMHWECCSRWGIRPVQPFFTRRVLELAFQCHPTELFGPGSKKILRRALSGSVPNRYLERPDKGHWNVRHHKHLTDRKTAVLSDSVASVLSGEYQTPGSPLTREQDRQLSQIVLFARKLREIRHAGTGKV